MTKKYLRKIIQRFEKKLFERLIQKYIQRFEKNQKLASIKNGMGSYIMNIILWTISSPFNYDFTIKITIISNYARY